MADITTKAKMYRYLESGLFGNTAIIYSSVSDVPDNELVSVRYAQVSSIGRCIYGINKTQLHTINLDHAIICEYPQANADVVMNCELMESTSGMYLRYKVKNIIMRDAMRSPDIATGLTAKIILQRYLDASSLNNLLRLYNTYRDHVIEFTVFDSAVGVLSLPTIIWEVRKY